LIVVKDKVTHCDWVCAVDIMRQSLSVLVLY